MKIFAPFRWAGSKAKLTSELFNKFNDATTYVEGFLGSGIVLFRLLQEKRYKRYVVNDINVSIIEFYKAIKKHPVFVVESLREIKEFYNNANDKEALYYSARKYFNQDKSNFIYFWLLQKAGFNGLYRENKKGDFNVSWGKKPKINFDEDMIYEISKLIQDVEFYNMDYRDFYTMLESDKDKFIYSDPPYCNSQSYSAGGFDNRKLAAYLEDMNCDIAISDVDSESSRLTYGAFKKNFIKEQNRVINIRSITTKVEVLYTNY